MKEKTSPKKTRKTKKPEKKAVKKSSNWFDYLKINYNAFDNGTT